MYFKTNLIYLMDIKKLSAPTLAKLSGVPKTTINSIKSTNSKSLNLETAYKIAKAFHISLDTMVEQDLSKTDTK